MKKLLFLFALVSTSVMAETCDVSLTSIRGSILGRFNGYGYSRQEACQDAIRSCQYEKDRRIFDRDFRDATCRIENSRYPTPNPYPTPGDERELCSFDLKRADGHVIDSFNARGPSERHACMKALVKCEDELRFRHTQGRNPRAYCEKSFGRGRDDRRDRPVYETKTCMVDRVGPRGRILQTHISTATGPIGTNVQGQACRSAASECEVATRYTTYQRCVARSYVDDVIDDIFDNDGYGNGHGRGHGNGHGPGRGRR